MLLLLQFPLTSELAPLSLLLLNKPALCWKSLLLPQLYLLVLLLLPRLWKLTDYPTPLPREMTMLQHFMQQLPVLLPVTAPSLTPSAAPVPAPTPHQLLVFLQLIRSLLQKILQNLLLILDNLSSNPFPPLLLKLQL